jgi:hypothetical protein
VTSVATRWRGEEPSKGARPVSDAPNGPDLRASGTMTREQLLPRIFDRVAHAADWLSRCVIIVSYGYRARSADMARFAVRLGFCRFRA